MSSPYSTVTTVTPATIPQPAQGARVVKQVTYQAANLTIPPNDIYELFDDQETGDLVGFEIATDVEDVILQVSTYADNPTYPNFINNFTMKTLLQLGRGLTPGEVQILPNGQSQDIRGTPSSVYPYLARYKTDELIDFSGNIQPAIVLKFEPTIYTSFKRIIANIINKSLTTTATVVTLDIKRLVYANLGTWRD